MSTRTRIGVMNGKRFQAIRTEVPVEIPRAVRQPVEVHNLIRLVDDEEELRPRVTRHAQSPMFPDVEDSMLRGHVMGVLGMTRWSEYEAFIAGAHENGRLRINVSSPHPTKPRVRGPGRKTIEQTVTPSQRTAIEKGYEVLPAPAF